LYNNTAKCIILCDFFFHQSHKESASTFMVLVSYIMESFNFHLLTAKCINLFYQVLKTIKIQIHKNAFRLMYDILILKIVGRLGFARRRARGAKVSLHYLRLTGVERRMRARTRERRFDLCGGRVRAFDDEHKNRILITSTLYIVHCICFRRTATLAPFG
jgi:hypothetical protein